MANFAPHILKTHAQARTATAWRVVETQEIAATRSITSSADDQSRLEMLLDGSKPQVPPDCIGLDYLLMTPFRYPPLAYGSRFGSIFERGIFYASHEIETAFAETAVYFWLFQSGPTTLGPLAVINDQRTAFSIRLASEHALDLRDPKLQLDLAQLQSPTSWHYTQALGQQLRTDGIEFFSYPSARKPEGDNIAVLSPAAFASKKPKQQLTWNVRLSDTSCWFGRAGEKSIEFNRCDFEMNGRIPHPAL